MAQLTWSFVIISVVTIWANGNTSCINRISEKLIFAFFTSSKFGTWLTMARACYTFSYFSIRVKTWRTVINAFWWWTGYLKKETGFTFSAVRWKIAFTSDAIVETSNAVMIFWIRRIIHGTRWSNTFIIKPNLSQKPAIKALPCNNYSYCSSGADWITPNFSWIRI